MTSPGARYSAGTAILDVVPSFKGVQEAIAKKAREMEKALGKEAGEQFGKSFAEGHNKAIDKALNTTANKDNEEQGRKAGEKYAGAFSSELKKALAATNREVRASIKLTTDDKDLQDNLKAIDKQLRKLQKAKIGIDMDASEALRKAEQIRVALQVLQENASIDLRTNFGAAFRAIEQAEKRIQKLSEMDAEIEIKIDDSKLGVFGRTLKARLKAAMSNLPDIAFNADASDAESALQRLRMAMATLSDKRIGIDISADEALAEMSRIRTLLATLATNQTIDLNVRTDAAGAAADLLKIKALAELVDKTKVEIKIDTDKTISSRLQSIRSAVLGTGQDGQQGANGFRAFNAVVLAGAALLPGLVPIIAAVGGALALIGPLAIGAAAGLGVMLIGFSGIGDAVKAMGKSRETAGKDAEAAAKRERAAMRSVEDAQRAVTNAEESGSRAIENANKAVADARENAAEVAQQSARRVADAIQNQKDAEQDLVRAQQDVVRAQEAVTQARRDAREELEDLQLSLRGGSLAERQAVFDLKDAQDAYNESLDDPDASAEDRARRLLDLEKEQLALDTVRERNGDLAIEQAEWARTGVDGSERVVSAQEGVQAAQDGVATAQRRVADATAAVSEAILEGQKAQADASRAITDAVASQRQAQTDAARSVADAQRNLTQAQEDYTTAVNETSASQQALEVAMGKLGPAGQEFATFLSNLQPQLRGIRDLVQAGMFPGLQDAITSILTVNGPMLTTFMSTMGVALGDMFRSFGELMTSPQWQGIWASFAEYAPIFMSQFGEMAMNMLSFFGELFVALAPYAERFGDALIRSGDAAVLWAASLKDSEGFKQTMEWLFTNGPAIWEDLKNIFGGLINLFVALLPFGMVILDIFGGIFGWIADLDPSTLGVLATTMIGLVIAFQVAAGVVALMSGAALILASAVTIAVFAIISIGVALVALYLYSETFRDGVNAVLHTIGDLFVWLWESAIKPALDAIMAGWADLYPVLRKLWDTLWPLIKLIGQVVGALFAGVVAAVLGIFNGIFQALEPIFGGIIRALEGVFQIIQGTIDFFIGLFTGDWERMAQGTKDIIGGMLGIIAGLFETVFGGLWNFLKGFIEGIIGFWEWLFDVLVGHSIVPDLVNAIFDWFKKMAEWVMAVVGPFIDAVIAIFSFLWEGVKVIFNLWLAGWKLLIDGFMLYWDYVLHPLLDVVMAIFNVVWEVVKVIFVLWLAAWKVLIEGIKLAWDYILHPLLDAVLAVFGFLWDGIKVIFDWIQAGWSKLADAMKWVYDNVIKPYVIEPFMALIDTLRGAFDVAVTAIQTIWERLQIGLAKPINFVIKYVLNEGLFGAFNWVVDTLHLNADWKIKPWDQIGDPAAHYAAGGRVGGYSPHDKADNIPAMLTANEYVQPVNVVDHYGVNAMDLIRKKKIPREVFDPQYYATGGLVALGRRLQGMGARVAEHPDFPPLSMTGHGRTSLHYTGHAIDVNTRAGTSALEQRELTPMAELAKSLGFRTIFMAPDHYNHLHIDDGGGSSIGNALASIGNAIAGGVSWVGDKLGNAWSAVTDVFGSIKNSITGPLADFGREFGDTAPMKIIKDIPNNLVGKMWDKVKDSVAGFFSGFGDTDSPVHDIPTAQQSGPVQDIVRGVAARYGWNQGKEWESLYALIQKESSWNPKAQNPTSTAYGLFQFLNGTWAGTGINKTSDVEGQATAGMQYLSQRYGTPSKAWAFHQSHNWYSEGGSVKGDAGKADAPAGAPTLYDTGGWLPPGITTVLNATTKPEPILTGQQWEAMTSGGDDGDYDGARGIRDLHLHEVNADLSEAIDRVNHTVRVLQRGGRY